MCRGASHVPPILHQGRSTSCKERKLLSRIRHFRHSVCTVAHGAGRHTPPDIVTRQRAEHRTGGDGDLVAGVEAAGAGAGVEQAEGRPICKVAVQFAKADALRRATAASADASAGSRLAQHHGCAAGRLLLRTRLRVLSPQCVRQDCAKPGDGDTHTPSGCTPGRETLAGSRAYTIVILIVT